MSLPRFDIPTTLPIVKIGKATFIIYLDRMSEWRFRFVCGAGVPRLRASEGYNAKANVQKAVESVRRNAQDERRYEFKVNSRGKHFFTLRARNGNTLGVSRNHGELDELEADAETLRRTVSEAELQEQH